MRLTFMDRIKHMVGSMLIGLLGFLILKAAYDEFAPVVMFMHAAQVEHTKMGEVGDIVYLVRGYKIRGCGLVKDSGISWYRDLEGTWTEAGTVDFPSDVGDQNSRPSSWFERQSFGLFKLNDIPNEAKTVRATVNHLCGDDPVPKVTDNGEWIVEW